MDAAPDAIALVGGDLNARVRVERAARARGLDVVTATVDELRSARARLVIVDLDVGGRAVLDALASARRSGDVDAAIFGYYSHVDDALADAARAAGIEALPRGRFWRELDEVVARAAD